MSWRIRYGIPSYNVYRIRRIGRPGAAVQLSRVLQPETVPYVSNELSCVSKKTLSACVFVRCRGQRPPCQRGHSAPTEQNRIDPPTDYTSTFHEVILEVTECIHIWMYIYTHICMYIYIYTYVQINELRTYTAWRRYHFVSQPKAKFQAVSNLRRVAAAAAAYGPT